MAEVLIEKTDIERAQAPLDVDTISLRNPGFNNMIIQTLMHYSGDLTDVAGKTAEQVHLSLGETNVTQCSVTTVMVALLKSVTCSVWTVLTMDTC